MLQEKDSSGAFSNIYDGVQYFFFKFQTFLSNDDQ